MVLSLLACLQISAQQEQQISQYQFNKYRINPAYGGLDYSLTIDALIRSQWTGIPGSPNTQYIGANIPTFVWNGAVGVEMYRESAGHLSHVHVTGSYNYVKGLSFGFLSIGGRVGALQSQLDGGQLRTSDGIYSDIDIDHQDPLLATGQQSGIGLLAEAGTYLYMQDAQVGISISRIPNYRQALDPAGIDHVLHADLFGEYIFKVNEEIAVLQNILLKTDLSIVQTDLSTTAVINGSIFGGIGIRGYSSRSIDAVIITAGLKLGDHYRLTYSYDAGLSDLKRAHEGSHEIMLNYNLRKLIGLAAIPKVEYNPRDL